MLPSTRPPASEAYFIKPSTSPRAAAAPEASASSGWRRDAWSRGSLLGVIVLFVYLFVFHFHHESRGNGMHLGDFPTFYIAAEYARDHRDIYTAGTSAAMIYVYPPLIAFLFRPLAALPIRTAAKVDLLLNTFALFASVFLAGKVMLRRLDFNEPFLIWPVVLVLSLLSVNEMRAVLTMLETDAIMLLMFTLGLYWLDRRPAWAGLALALGLNIKYLPIVMVPYLVLRRRWMVLGWMLAGAVFFALVPCIELGWHEDLRCLRVSSGGLLRWIGVPPEKSGAIKVHDIADDLSVSVTSMIARVLRPRGFSNPDVMAFAAGVGLICLAVTAELYRRRGEKLLSWPAAQAQTMQPFHGLVAIEWAGLVAAALVFSPDTNTRHLVLTVLVNALAAALILAPSGSQSRWIAAWAAGLIFICYIMPFGAMGTPIHFFYFKYSFPGWGLLIGYLLLLKSGLDAVRHHGIGAKASPSAEA